MTGHLALYKRRMASYGLKTVSNTLRILLRTLLSFHAIIVWAWHVWSGHPRTTERVRYMQARLQAATSLLGINCV